MYIKLEFVLCYMHTLPIDIRCATACQSEFALPFQYGNHSWFLALSPGLFIFCDFCVFITFVVVAKLQYNIKP